MRIVRGSIITGVEKCETLTSCNSTDDKNRANLKRWELDKKKTYHAKHVRFGRNQKRNRMKNQYGVPGRHQKHIGDRNENNSGV